MADEAAVDLVEIAAQASPPVVKLMDYGKFRYQEQKRAAEAKSKQKTIQVKEIKFRPGTDDGDYMVKLRNLIRFLEEGDKAKITLQFRGREMAHPELGSKILDDVIEQIVEVGKVETQARLEGRSMTMVLVPDKKNTKKKDSAAAGAEETSAPTSSPEPTSPEPTSVVPSEGPGES